MASTPGTVYIFNATARDVTLNLNGSPLSGISSISKSNSYAANSTTAPRNPASGNPGINEFGGSNNLLITFPGGTTKPYQINGISDADFDITKDIQIYIFFNMLVMVLDSRGSLPSSSNAAPGARQVVITSSEPTDDAVESSPVSETETGSDYGS